MRVFISLLSPDIAHLCLILKDMIVNGLFIFAKIRDKWDSF